MSARRSPRLTTVRQGAHPPLWQVSISTSVEAEDATAELLQSLTSAPVSSYHERATNTVRVQCHLLQLPSSAHRLRQQLRSGLQHILACGLDPVPARITIRLLPPTNWTESWKKHFPPLKIANALLIQPEWIHRRPLPGQELIILDPGLSFGTGHHPTTRFCLQQLVKARPTKQPKSMLDIGTGSGLLAIAAAKLGYRPVHAFDLDPLAVRVAQANTRRNGVSRTVRVRQTDVTRLTSPLKPHTVVCANLHTDLLLDHAVAIAAAVMPGGLLVLAGILRDELPQVRSVYAALHLNLATTRTGQEWGSIALARS